MKTINFKKFLFLPLLFLMVFTSCQKEAVEIIDSNTEETLEADSNLANLMRFTTINDGSIDNIIDFANCLEVQLPVTVIVNDITITINSLEDLELIEAIFDEFDDDDNDIEIIFPITIISADHSEIIIESQEALEELIDECHGEDEEDDDIECIDFQYPISISIYNTDFEVIDTVTINEDEDLYEFIENLEGGVLASINFPVTMILSDGTAVVVENNTELEAAISAAEDDCDEDDDYDWDDDDYEDCTDEEIESVLTECRWYAGTNLFTIFVAEYFYFLPDGTVEIYNSETDDLTNTGTWEISSDTGTGNLYLVLDFDMEPYSLLSGMNWDLVECDDDRLQFVSGDNTLVFEQECVDDGELPFDCFSHATFTMCDGETDDNMAEFNLESLYLSEIDCSVDYSASFHESYSDAETDSNEIMNPGSYINNSNPQTIYVRVEALSGEVEIFEIQLIVEACVSSCNELDVDTYLTECIWNVVNYEGDDHLINWDFDFNSDGTVIVTGEGLTATAMWSTSMSGDGVVVSFSGIALTDIQVIDGEWLVVECEEGRLQFINNAGATFVMERDCTGTGGTVEDLEGTVIEGEWIVANYNDSGIDETDDFNGFVFNFSADGTVTTTNGSDTVSGNWSAIMDTGQLKLVLDFGMVIPFDEFNDDWDVISFVADRVELRDVSGGSGEIDVLVFERL